MPLEGMQISSYPLTHTGTSLYKLDLWNASEPGSKQVKQMLHKVIKHNVNLHIFLSLQRC